MRREKGKKGKRRVQADKCDEKKEKGRRGGLERNEDRFVGSVGQVTGR